MVIPKHDKFWKVYKAIVNGHKAQAMARHIVSVKTNQIHDLLRKQRVVIRICHSHQKIRIISLTSIDN